MNKKIIAASFATLLLITDVASAASFGRSGGVSSSRSFSSSSSRSFSSSSSRSFSSSSSRPSSSFFSSSRRSATPSSSSGIGSSGAMGVRKPTVMSQVQPSRQSNTSYSSSRSQSSGSGFTSPSPSYSQPVAHQYVNSGSGGGFGSSFMGSLGGTMLGNALFGNHGGGYNSAPSVVVAGGAGAGAAVANNSGEVVPAGGQVVVAAPEHSYGIGSFILDVLMIALLVAVLIALALLAYKGYKTLRAYIKTERGEPVDVKPQPIQPTEMFWLIQDAFSKADVTELKRVLGPDLVDEVTRDIQPVSISLSNVSHQVVLSTNQEFSVHYTFFDKDTDEWVEQVWHYELHGGNWKLNGIEPVKG